MHCYNWRGLRKLLYSCSCSCLTRYVWRRNNNPWGIEAALLFANLPTREYSSSQTGKWKRQCLANERWERIHQISFTVPSTLISHWLGTLYILKFGGVNWLVTKQNSWIPYLIQAQHSSSSCQCSILQKATFWFHSI